MRKMKVFGWLLGIALCACMVLGMPLAVFAAETASDLTVNIDTGASVTLKDSDGDGYYEIGTADELYAFAAAVNGGKNTIDAILTENIVINSDVLDADGKLISDTKALRKWIPIGWYQSKANFLVYDGIINGNDKTISGLYYDSSEKLYAGLFGYSTGTVSDLTIMDSYIKNTHSDGRACLVIGYNKGSIINCHTSGYVFGSWHVGGIVGWNEGNIIGCSNSATVSTNGGNAGGITGYHRVGIIEDCTNTGTPFADVKNVGGIAGGTELGATICKCSNTADIIVSANYVGGIVGIVVNDAVVEYCYNTGSISGAKYVGGIAGGDWNQGVVRSCYNASAVSGTSVIGGLVGYNTLHNGGAVLYSVCNRDLFSGSEIGTNCGCNISTSYSRTTEAFASGAVTWILNAFSSEGVWKQTIGVDSMPSFTGDTVYEVKCCDGKSDAYSNTNKNKSHTPDVYSNKGDDHSYTCKNCSFITTEDHSYVSGICACGATKYLGWTEVNCSWYYYDPDTNVPVTGIVRVPYPTETINGNTYGPDQDAMDYCENKGTEFIDAEYGWFYFDEEDGCFRYDWTGIDWNEEVYAENGFRVWHPGLVYDEDNDEYYYFTGDNEHGGNKLATGDVYISSNQTERDVVISGLYTFGENGALCEYDGITEVNGVLRYYKDAQLMLGNGLTKVDDRFIYVRSNGELVVDAEYYVPTNDLGIDAGNYTFDENGYLVIPEVTEKNGVYFENGAWYYYEDGKIGYNKGLIYVDTVWYGADGSENAYSGYIYVRSSGVLASGTYYITNVNEGVVGFRSGQKVLFNDLGIANTPKHGIVDVNGTLYYYQYNAIAYNAGLIEYNGSWIYVRSNGVLATGLYWITNTDGNMEQGCYEFGTDGCMIISAVEDGIVSDNGKLYYYLDGKKQYGLGLVMQEDGSYIYVRSNGELAVSTYWITNHNGLLTEGLYEFNSNGILTVG